MLLLGSISTLAVSRSTCFDTIKDLYAGYLRQQNGTFCARHHLMFDILFNDDFAIVRLLKVVIAVVRSRTEHASRAFARSWTDTSRVQGIDVKIWELRFIEHLRGRERLNFCITADGILNICMYIRITIMWDFLIHIFRC